MEIFLSIVHYPVYNKNMQVVTTSITNYDIHDIARSCKTYDIKKYYIVHPLENQQEIVKKILDYWQEGYGKEYNSDRNKALENVSMSSDIQSVVDDIKAKTGLKPIIVTTDARLYDNTVSYIKLRDSVKDEKRPLLLIFGTGWGIETNTMKEFDYILEPIVGRGQYNHLSVRSAVAIILDRLLGEEWWTK